MSYGNYLFICLTNRTLAYRIIWAKRKLSLIPPRFPFLGHYLYIETSSPRRFGDTAKLVTRGGGEDKCMTFFYHMFGKQTGRLAVLQDSPGVPLLEKPMKLWQKEGDQGNKWIEAKVMIPGRRMYRVSLVYSAVIS